MPLALLLAASLPHILAGPSFEAFATRTDRLCPARHRRSVTPGDLDYVQDEFRTHLAARDRQRLAAADHVDARCAGHNGLSCSVGETLDAMRRTALLDRFAASTCTAKLP